LACINTWYFKPANQPAQANLADAAWTTGSPYRYRVYQTPPNVIKAICIYFAKLA